MNLQPAEPRPSTIVPQGETAQVRAAIAALKRGSRRHDTRR